MSNSTFDPTLNIYFIRNITISGLRSATAYDYRFVADYLGYNNYDNNQYYFMEQYFQQTQQVKTKGIYFYSL